MTKQAIRKTIGRTFIYLQQLQTITVEIESMLNDRLLTYVNSNLQDCQPLTRSHLLYGKRIQQVPHSLEYQEKVSDVYVTAYRKTSPCCLFESIKKSHFLNSLPIHTKFSHVLQVRPQQDEILKFDWLSTGVYFL